jgi:uncharacterized SAM-binding protein YcdF (DUF218 family)
MMYLHRLLPIFVLPLGAALLAVVVGLLSHRKALAWGGIGLLWLSSLPAASTRMIRLVEGGAERAATGDAPRASAIVVLSAGRSLAPGPSQVSEWGDPDRFFAGVDLFQAGKAAVIVFTGGTVPWVNQPLEGDVLREWAHRLGIADDRILTTGAVMTTAEEAAAVRALLDDKGQGRDVLLVTSAFHMARARQLFEAAGLVVLPFPVDFRSTGDATLNILSFVPTSDALRETEIAAREMYARLYYRWF